MRTVAVSGNTHVLSFSRGEELFATFLSWASEKGIKGATFTGLGAADFLELAYYHIPTKTYERKNIEEEVEILSLTGNFGALDGAPVLHIHGSFGRRDFSAFGGHLFKLRVSGACEAHVTVFSEALNRAYDEETGLNLLAATRMPPAHLFDLRGRTNGRG